MSRKDHQESDKKRDEILEAARALFAHFGFKKTTLEDIAEKAHLRKPTLYYYYESKEQIFSEVITREMEEFLDTLRSAVEACPSAGEQVRAFVKTRYSHFRKKKNLYSITQNAMSEIGPLVTGDRERFFEAEAEILAGVFKLGNESGEFSIDKPDVVALVAIAGLAGLDHTFWLHGKEDQIDEGIDVLLDVIIRGIAKPGR